MRFVKSIVVLPLQLVPYFLSNDFLSILSPYRTSSTTLEVVLDSVLGHSLGYLGLGLSVLSLRTHLQIARSVHSL